MSAHTFRLPEPFPRLTRSRRRVLLALLAGVPMTQLALMGTAQADSGTVNVILGALLAREWADGDYEPRTKPLTVPQVRRMQYWLTPDGRAAVLGLLNLKDETR